MRSALALAFLLPCLCLGAIASSSRAEDIFDHRQPALLTEAEKDFILDQMRLFLNSITEIEDGLGAGDLDRVAQEGAARGRKANLTLARPPSLMAKESEDWRAMFLSVRKGFDTFTDQAQQHASSATINKTLADTMRNCVACHQTYRLVVEAR